LAAQDRVEARRLKGFRDLLPGVAASKEKIIQIARQEAYLAGFQPIATPALEYADILVGSGGGETEKEVYKFQDHGERLVGLRFDLTVPFARFVAEHQNELAFPFKKFQVDEVWRGEKPQKGRYRQFCQADLDIVGADSVAADFEVISTLLRIIEGTVNQPFTMMLSHRAVISGLIKHFFPAFDTAGENSALIALDKLGKVGAEIVQNMLVQIPGGTEAGAKSFLQVISRKDAAGHSDLAAIGDVVASDAVAAGGIARLDELIALLSPVIPKSGKVLVDLSVARGLGYYTGVVFETTIDSLPGFGSVSSGGRYDQLLSRFTNRSLPGVGGSLGVDRVLGALEELQKIPTTAAAKVYVAIATEDAQTYGIQLALELRQSGIATDYALSAGKLGNQFKYADKNGCPLVVTVGSDELKAQQFSLKNMRTGMEEKGLAAAGLVRKIQVALQ